MRIWYDQRREDRDQAGDGMQLAEIDSAEMAIVVELSARDRACLIEVRPGVRIGIGPDEDLAGPSRVEVELDRLLALVRERYPPPPTPVTSRDAAAHQLIAGLEVLAQDLNLVGDSDCARRVIRLRDDFHEGFLGRKPSGSAGSPAG